MLGLLSLFLAALLPNLGLLPFAFQGFSTVADRYGAPSLIALALAWAFLAHWLHRPAYKILLAIPLILFAGLAWKQSQYWRDSETLFTYTIEHNPRSPAALINRSKARIEATDYQGALKDAEDCMTYAPDFLPSYMNCVNPMNTLVAMKRRSKDSRPSPQDTTELRVCLISRCSSFNLFAVTRKPLLLSSS